MIPLTGDEPHYLVLAESVLSDADLRVANNYAQQKYRDYYPHELEPHLLGGENPRTRRYSLHAPALALIIVPAFAVFGHWGAIGMLAAIAAVGTAFVWSAGHLLTQSPGAAWFGWAVITLTLPVALFGSLIYPDAVAGTAVAIGVWALIRTARAGLSTTGPLSNVAPVGDATLSTATLIGVSIPIALLPWLHTRLAIPAMLLALVLVLRIWAQPQRWRHVSAFILPLIISYLGWVAYLQLAFGSIDPRSPFGGETPVRAANIVNGLAGMFADQEFGLLPNSPVYAIAFSGLWLLGRRNRRLAAEIALIVAPYTVATSGYPMWWGGHCPPARFLLPVLFPFGATAALLWFASGINGRRVALALLLASVALVPIMTFVQAGSLAYNHADGSARWIEWVGGTEATRVLPSFVRGDR